MKHTELISTARPFEQCLEDIKRNKDISFKWFAATGKDGCLFEIGGRNRDGLELLAYIPKYDENGIPLIYELNGFVEQEYSFDGYGFYFPRYNIPKTINVVKFIKQTDFRIWKPKLEFYLRTVQTEMAAKITNFK